MEKKFLGKSIPRQSASFRKRKRVFSWQGGLLMAVPFMAFGAFLAFQPQYSNSPDTASRAVGPAITRTLSVQDPSKNVSAPPAAAKTCADVIAGLTDGSGTPTSTTIFPIIPDQLGSDSKDCSPSFWDRSVIIYFVAKGLVILNWLATTLAILFTLYAGLLYISGFAKEDNVKKAKTLLIATYTGLAIVILARVIIFSAVDLFNNTPSKDSFNSSGIPIYVGNSPSASPKK